MASAAQHAELLERINQLNLLRESNATLRSECEAHRKRAEGLNSKLRQLTAEVDPVKEETRLLRAELESRDHQLERLGRENQQWKDRSQQILNKVCSPSCDYGLRLTQQSVRSYRSCRNATTQRQAGETRNREDRMDAGESHSRSRSLAGKKANVMT